jgi:hypothetical protein
MRVPWRFILALPSGLIFGIALFIALLYSQLGIPTESSHWISDIILKKEACAAHIAGPRLFLVAGSNVLFGLNAQRIEQQTGIPTINFGVHGALGLHYILQLTQRNVRPGDTVLLVLEYDFYSHNLDSEQLDDYILARDPDYFRRLSLLDKIDMATCIPFKRIQKGFRNSHTPESVRAPQPPFSPYTPISAGIDCLDENGDEVFNLESARSASTPKLQEQTAVLVGGLSDENTYGFRELAAFLKWAQEQHISVVATYPNILHQPVYDEPAGQKVIETIAHFYASHGISVIGTAQEAMLPADQFFDTNYHLTHEAALERTDRLLPELAPLLHPAH